MNKEKISAFYTYLLSQQTAQQFLYHCYKQQQWEDPETKSYENSTAFLYYLKHGQIFYETGKEMPAEIKPISLFYGMVHLLKAALLSRRPQYPESTKVLAHGVSTRKRKKRDYTFLEDEVKIQQFGLFPYFSKHLYGLNYLPTEKFKMIHLLSVIPEVNIQFQLDGEETLCKVSEIGKKQITFPSHILDTYHLTAQAFITRIEQYLPKLTEQIITDRSIQIELNDPIRILSAPFYTHINKAIYFPLFREHFSRLSEVMVHYLLLYNLSMVSRYETEWWGDLVATKADKDYAFISQFLHVTSEKIPLLIGQDLYTVYESSSSKFP